MKACVANVTTFAMPHHKRRAEPADFQHDFCVRESHYAKTLDAAPRMGLPLPQPAAGRSRPMAPNMRIAIATGAIRAAFLRDICSVFFKLESSRDVDATNPTDPDAGSAGADQIASAPDDHPLQQRQPVFGCYGADNRRPVGK